MACPILAWPCPILRRKLPLSCAVYTHMYEYVRALPPTDLLLIAPIASPPNSRSTPLDKLLYVLQLCYVYMYV